MICIFILEKNPDVIRKNFPDKNFHQISTDEFNLSESLLRSDAKIHPKENIAQKVIQIFFKNGVKCSQIFACYQFTPPSLLFTGELIESNIKTIIDSFTQNNFIKDDDFLVLAVHWGDQENLDEYQKIIDTKNKLIPKDYINKLRFSYFGSKISDQLEDNIKYPRINEKIETRVLEMARLRLDEIEIDKLKYPLENIRKYLDFFDCEDNHEYRIALKEFNSTLESLNKQISRLIKLIN